MRSLHVRNHSLHEDNVTAGTLLETKLYLNTPSVEIEHAESFTVFAIVHVSNVEFVSVECAVLVLPWNNNVSTVF